LESYFQEARELLAATLISMLDAPEHWNVPMLLDNHPSSFCQLLGLTTEELLHPVSLLSMAKTMLLSLRMMRAIVFYLLEWGDSFCQKE
jgi:hypothetical protein